MWCKEEKNCPHMKGKLEDFGLGWFQSITQEHIIYDKQSVNQNTYSNSIMAQGSENIANCWSPTNSVNN